MLCRTFPTTTTTTTAHLATFPLKTPRPRAYNPFAPSCPPSPSRYRYRTLLPAFSASFRLAHSSSSTTTLHPSRTDKTTLSTVSTPSAPLTPFQKPSCSPRLHSRLSPVLSSALTASSGSISPRLTSAIASGISTSDAPPSRARAHHTSRPHYATITDTHTQPHTQSHLRMTTTLAPQLHANGQLTPPLTPKGSKQALRSIHPSPTPEQNLLRLRNHLDTLPTPLLKHVHLSKVRREDPNLFFAAMKDDLPGLAPLVYTPTVGEACQKYSHIYSQPEGLYLSIDDKDMLPQILSEYAALLPRPPQIMVVTDGSRILGLGDLGIGGMGISVGKLNLYVAGGGIDPSGTLPIILDMGTNTESIRNDPLYIGLRRPRATLQEATEFMDAFMAAASAAFPAAVIQHEDFYSEAAFDFLERYQDKYRMFNDDIQGTGSVILGGFFAAARQASAASGLPLRDHKVVFLGGGSAAVGVAKEMMNFFRMQGLSEQEAKERFWLIDTKGLITSSRPDVVAGKLASHKKYFIRYDTEGKEYSDLASVVEYVQPTALVGLSTTFGAFDRTVVRRMADMNAAPIIFPLSNPTSKCELSFTDALNWTNGTVLFASGSPYPAERFGGRLREPAQGNNFLVFPGIGFGAMACKATKVTDEMITASALALSEARNQEEIEAGLLYPRLERIREVSAIVAAGVVKKAQEQGVDTEIRLRGLTNEQLVQKMLEAQWHP